jgi:hypothetical protein
VPRGGAHRFTALHADMSHPPGATPRYRIRRARILSQVGRRGVFLSSRVRKSRQARAPASISATRIRRIQYHLIASGGHNGALVMKLATY